MLFTIWILSLFIKSRIRPLHCLRRRDTQRIDRIVSVIEQIGYDRSSLNECKIPDHTYYTSSDSCAEMSIFLCISIPEECFNLANGADTDEIPHNAAFHLDVHCLPKYLFASNKNEEC